jgi:hypothetical protein
LFPWRWQSRRVRAFIEGVNDKVNRLLIWECEHILEASYQFIFTGLLCAASAFEIKVVEYVTMTMRLLGKLSKEGREQVTTVLLVDIPKIKVKICHGKQSIGT